MKLNFYPPIKRLCTAIALLTLMLLVDQSQVGLPALAQGSETTAFINVNVIPMDTEQVLEDHVVIVANGLIKTVSPAAGTVILEGVNIIDGQGGYLMPGLADMHMHLQTKEAYRDPEQLLSFLSQGTTSIRSLGTAPEAYPWREQVERSEIIGPTIYTMGRTLMGNYENFTGMGMLITLINIARLLIPLLLGTVVFVVFKPLRSRRNIIIGGGMFLLLGVGLVLTKTPPFMIAAPSGSDAYIVENVRQIKTELNRQQEWDVDGVKLYDGLAETQYLAAVAEAHQRGFYVTGHMLDQSE
jgi:hypothetical protein